MARLELSDARKLMQKGRPWTFRLECRDLTTNTNKFWLATGRGRNEPVEVRYGRNGSKGAVIIKDWAYVEAKAPAKIADGYDYVRTPFVRVRQSTIDAHNTAMAAKQAPTLASQAAQASTTAPVLPAPNQPVKDKWDCPSGGVKVYKRSNTIDIVFDVFPAKWQDQSVFGTFVDTIDALVNGFVGQTPKVKVEWGGQRGNEFVIQSSSVALYSLVVHWLRKQIPGPTPALVDPPKMTGPFAEVYFVRPSDKGWHGLNKYGDKIVTLTAKAARHLVQTYSHIEVAGT